VTDSERDQDILIRQQILQLRNGFGGTERAQSFRGCASHEGFFIPKRVFCQAHRFQVSGG
jgi:hypothetical protein